MINPITYKLIIAQLFRIISTLIILFYLKFPLYIKILFIMLTELIDCSPAHHYITEWVNCKSFLYQSTDKITDTIIYTILFIYFIIHTRLSNVQNYILLFLLMFRIIGTTLFILNNSRRYLILFPNFFLVISLTFAYFNYFKKYNKFLYLTCILGIIYKISHEIYLHI